MEVLECAKLKSEFQTYDSICGFCRQDIQNFPGMVRSGFGTGMLFCQEV